MKKSHTPFVRLLLIALFCCVPFSSYSKEFTVDSTEDAIDISPGDGICESAPGVCTLRAAVMETNALTGADIIRLPAGLYTLSIGSTGENLGAEGDLDLLDDLSIIGEPASTIISGGNNFRIFSILPPQKNIHPSVTFKDLTLTKGNEVVDDKVSIILNAGYLDLINVSVSEAGFGFYALGNEGGVLSLNNCQINDNTAAIFTRNGLLSVTDSEINRNLSSIEAAGSGIASINSRVKIINSNLNENTNYVGGAALFASDSDVEIEQSSIAGNTALSRRVTRGAGILAVRSNVLIKKTQIRNNRSVNGAGISYKGQDDLQKKNTFLKIVDSVVSNNKASSGGGILLRDSGTSGNIIILENNEISENSAFFNGGGISYGDNGELRISNTTISHNVSDMRGGGIYVSQNNNAHISVTNTTIAFNDSASGANIHNMTSNVSLTNTIVANAINGVDCEGTIISNGNNLDSDDSCGLSVETGDIPLADPLLEVLADNGGASRTLALMNNSPAIDAGDAVACESLGAYDQRYHYRNDGACDIGAFEFDSVPAVSGTLAFSTNTLTVNESEDSFSVTVKRLDGSDGAAAATVYVKHGGTASNNEDFIYTPVKLEWADGESADKTVIVELIDNDIADEDKSVTFTMAVLSSSVMFSESEDLTVSIKDDEMLAEGFIQFSAAEYIVSEDKSFVDVLVSRVGGLLGDISFVLTSEKLERMEAVIESGHKGILLRFDIASEQNNIFEGDSVFELTLESVGNVGELGEITQAKIIVKEDELEPLAPGEIAFEKASYSISENQSEIELNIVRSGGFDGEMLGMLEIKSGSAEFPSDFGGINKQDVQLVNFRFLEESSKLTVTIDIVNDELIEADETFTLSLSNLIGGATLGDSASAIVTIENDDVPAVVDKPQEKAQSTEQEVELDNNKSGRASTGALFLFVLLMLFSGRIIREGK